MFAFSVKGSVTKNQPASADGTHVRREVTLLRYVWSWCDLPVFVMAFVRLF